MSERVAITGANETQDEEVRYTQPVSRGFSHSRNHHTDLRESGYLLAKIEDKPISNRKSNT